MLLSAWSAMSVLLRRSSGRSGVTGVVLSPPTELRNACGRTLCPRFARLNHRRRNGVSLIPASGAAGMSDATGLTVFEGGLGMSGSASEVR